MPATLGPRASRAYGQLRQRINSGALAPGVKLVSHVELAAQLGVALATVRQALDRLQQEGLVSSIHGRGTFVTRPSRPAVLIVEDDLRVRATFVAYVTQAGFSAFEATTYEEGVSWLAAEPEIGLILADVRIPVKESGVRFIREAYARYHHIPLAAVTGYPDDLLELHGKPECPVLILTKPVHFNQIQSVLNFAIPAQRAYGT